MSDIFGKIFLKLKIIVYKKIDCENCGKALENLKIHEKHIVEEYVEKTSFLSWIVGMSSLWREIWGEGRNWKLCDEFSWNSNSRKYS